MSGLGDVGVRGGGTAAWPLLVAFVLGMAACSPGPGQAPPDTVSQAPGSSTEMAVQPPGASRTVTPGHVTPAPPGDRAPPRPPTAAIRPPDRPGGTTAQRLRPGPTHPVLVPGSVPPADRTASPGTGGAGANADLASYVARVSATDHIELPGAQGTLTVWIGLAQNLLQAGSGTASATQSLGMRGQTATITPFAPDFNVDPASTVCERVVPSGSEVNFALTPKRAGSLTVGANVQLFDSADCSGVPVPKSTSVILVQVQVCKMCYVQSGLVSMGRTAWTAFSHFWAWLLGVVFLTLGVLINRWRRRKFHITADEEQSKPGGGA